MNVDEARSRLEQAVNEIVLGDVQAYWNAFKTFCFQPVENEGQSIVLSCMTADFPTLGGHAFYVTFKRLIWSLDDDDELFADQIVCTLACNPPDGSGELSLHMGGEPLSDAQIAPTLEAIEKSLAFHSLLKLIPTHTNVYIA